ncbi:hypothetical protein KFE25_012953 [Diacronema lutheri]|uniref:Uncharacterized protein n=1 Tax=Diacronema lutheri TaxID=2081491 RepID=A0A8J5XDE3_DIALT|nr:hypothetical protein KFE25_012953 [Diacronema lutheri]
MLLEVATMRASRTSAQLPAALRGALREPKATLAAARARARAVVRLRLGALLWVWDGAVRAALLGACTLAESAPAQRVSRAATRAVARAVALAARERSPLPALGALGGQAPRNADLAHNQAPLTAVLAPRARPPAPAARLDCAGARARAMDALPAAPLPDPSAGLLRQRRCSHHAAQPALGLGGSLGGLCALSHAAADLLALAAAMDDTAACADPAACAAGALALVGERLPGSGAWLRAPWLLQLRAVARRAVAAVADSRARGAPDGAARSTRSRAALAVSAECLLARARSLARCALRPLLLCAHLGGHGLAVGQQAVCGTWHAAQRGVRRRGRALRRCMQTLGRLCAAAATCALLVV